jgi:hypothetical protein
MNTVLPTHQLGGHYVILAATADWIRVDKGAMGWCLDCTLQRKEVSGCERILICVPWLRAAFICLEEGDLFQITQMHLWASNA